MPGSKNPNIENNGLVNINYRLDKIEKQRQKMNVEPGMSMKTKEVKNRPRVEPGMFMKRKLLIVTNLECY